MCRLYLISLTYGCCCPWSTQNDDEEATIHHDEPERAEQEHGLDIDPTKNILAKIKKAKDEFNFTKIEIERNVIDMFFFPRELVEFYPTMDMENAEPDLLLCIEEDEASMYIPPYNRRKLPGYFYAKSEKLEDPRFKITKFLIRKNGKTLTLIPEIN